MLISDKYAVKIKKVFTVFKTHFKNKEILKNIFIINF